MNLMHVKNLSRRRGKWLISEPALRDAINGDQEARAAWHAAHGEAIIIAAEYRWGGVSVKYTGYHPDFEELPEGMMEPEYECVLTRTHDAAGTISFIATWKQVKRTP